MKVTLAIITILSLFKAQAAVNMRNGSYTESWIDFIDPKDGYEMKIERFYSSRSLFTGIFGFGWCSNIETHLNITSDGIINLTECGGGIEVTYYPETFDLNSPKQSIDAIIKHILSEKKLTSNNIKNLRAQLKANTKMRFEYANRLHLVDTKKLKVVKNTFIAKSKGLEKIYFDGSFYKRIKHDGSTEKFNKKGQLVQIINPYGLWVKINYKGKHVSFLVDKNGRRLNFNYDRNGNLQRIYNGRGLQTTYQFQGDNLVAVKNMWDKTYTYSYDSNHNLLAVLFPDKSSIKMSYDIANDWIKSYTNRLGCKETFKFLLSKDDPKNHYWGAYQRKCKGSPILSGRHEFWYKNYSFSKDKYLHRAQEVSGSDYKDVYFHPFLGRPTSVRENSTYMGYAYYLNGLVNKKESKLYSKQKEIINWTKSTYKYNLKKFNMTEALTNYLNKLGQSTHKKKTYFSYGKKGLLKKASTKKGSFIAVNYNTNGQVSSLKNQKKDILKIIYTPGSEKPTKIAHSRFGEVLISYDNQGEVASVESQGKRSVASSVIQSFLEMIEFLGPMGELLKI